MKQLKLLIYCTIFSFYCQAQDYGNLKFGDVKANDLSVKSYAIDSNASAVVLSEYCRCSFSGNNKGFFSLVSKYYKRVHILNKNGYDAAEVSIDLYTEDNDEEKLDKLRAVTYNLEDGKVVQTKLDNKSLFSEKPQKHWLLKKFTFPNVKEGSIIEFEYTTISDFLSSPREWLFQGSYPVIWSEYTFTVPSFFSYFYLRKGYLQYDIIDQKNSTSTFNIRADNKSTGSSESFSVLAGTTAFRWVVKNAPALKEENFTSSMQNHLQQIKFQLDEQTDPLTPHKYIESWPQFTAKIWEWEDFGKPVASSPAWLDEITDRLIKEVPSQTEKAKKIYEYVRDNYTCTGQSAWIVQNFKNIEKSRGGNVAELNLLMLTMFRRAGLLADPVIMSTRRNGRMYKEYPLYSQFNYVIDRVIIDGKTYYLDATEPGLGFGKLPLRCYNDQARVVNAPADLVSFSADNLLEQKTTSVLLKKSGKNLAGSFRQTPGYYESNELRRRIREKGKDGFIGDLKKEINLDITVNDLKFDSLANYDQPVSFNCQLSFPELKEEIVYLNPFFGEAYQENPFKSANRYYPVEMPYKIDETYNLTFDVPEDYIVDELPKDLIAKLNPQEDGIFEYRISQKGNTISLKSRIILNKANFPADNYYDLREFFNFIVKKQAEQIVLKKKK